MAGRRRERRDVRPVGGDGGAGSAGSSGPRPNVDAPEWRFPAGHCHEGMPLGNGTFGALLWSGEDRRSLRITVNRADYWLHAGGWEWPEEATYANLQAWLEADDEATLRRVFEGRDRATGARPDRPTRLPMGRVDLVVPHGITALSGWLDLDTGEATCTGAGSGGLWRTRAVVVRDAPLLALRFEGPGAGDVRAQARPPDAADVVAHLRAHGFPEPARFGDARAGGWVQVRPGEPALCVAWLLGDRSAADDGPDSAGERDERRMIEGFVAAVYGDTDRQAVDAAKALLAQAADRGYAALAGDVAQWWQAWWRQAARVDLPGSTAGLLYRLGLYKLGCLSVPDGPAASLQGPWVEEHRLPPWSSDFHFNVNVQECYWPAFGANHLETLDPLERMLAGWEPRLRENARRYVGLDDGLLLPHAVDDRGTCMGGFWTGQTDHGSTAWAGQLLWLRYRHSLHRDYLRDTVYPFLRGALRTYEAMLAPAGPDGRELCLPVGVSPEFGGSGARAWGRNASFQLACIHFLCRALLEASATLGLDGEDQARWRDVARRLPLASVGRGGRDVRGTEMVASAVPPGERELLLWEGQPLPESHRHHSHLAALYPFGLLNPLGDADEANLCRNSLRRLTLEGMGAWTGWCVPWAAILHARAGHGDAAALLLESFRRAFMGPGHYSTHDAVFRGLTVMASRPDIMQIEAGLGAAAAVLELLAQTNAPGGGVLRVFSGAPAVWRDVSFGGIRADGAFLLSAVREAGETREVRVRSEAGGTLRLAHPFGARAVVVYTGRGVERYADSTGMPVLTLGTSRGEELRLVPD